jgi:hypothetical protein
MPRQLPLEAYHLAWALMQSERDAMQVLSACAQGSTLSGNWHSHHCSEPDGPASRRLRQSDRAAEPSLRPLASQMLGVCKCLAVVCNSNSHCFCHVRSQLQLQDKTAGRPVVDSSEQLEGRHGELHRLRDLVGFC